MSESSAQTWNGKTPKYSDHIYSALKLQQNFWETYENSFFSSNGKSVYYPLMYARSLYRKRREIAISCLHFSQNATYHDIFIANGSGEILQKAEKSFQNRQVKLDARTKDPSHSPKFTDFYHPKFVSRLQFSYRCSGLDSISRSKMIFFKWVVKHFSYDRIFV